MQITLRVVEQLFIALLSTNFLRYRNRFSLIIMLDDDHDQDHDHVHGHTECPSVKRGSRAHEQQSSHEYELARGVRMLTSLLVTMATGSVARVALVTGGTKGIGLGIARGLGEANYRVHLTGRTAHGPTGSLEAAASAVRAAGGEAVVHQCDHSNPSAIQALFDEVVRENVDDLALTHEEVSEMSARVTGTIVTCLVDIFKNGLPAFGEKSAPPTPSKSSVHATKKQKV